MRVHHQKVRLPLLIASLAVAVTFGTAYASRPTAGTSSGPAVTRYCFPSVGLTQSEFLRVSVALPVSPSSKDGAKPLVEVLLYDRDGAHTKVAPNSQDVGRGRPGQTLLFDVLPDDPFLQGKEDHWTRRDVRTEVHVVPGSVPVVPAVEVVELVSGKTTLRVDNCQTVEDQAASTTDARPNEKSGRAASTVSLSPSTAVSAPARSYGITVAADGTGDYTTIAKAIAAVPPSGATILVKRGTYAAAFRVPANTTIQGEGDATVISFSAGAGVEMVADGGTLRNLQINGNRLGSGHGLNILGSGCLVENVTIRDVMAHGIQIRGPNNTIQNCRLLNISTDPAQSAPFVQKGIYIAGGKAARNRILHNYITGWSQAIGLWYGANHCVIDGNTAVHNYGNERALSSPTFRSAFEDFGQLVPGHGWNRWTNNDIRGSTSCCIEISTGVNGSVFSNNIVRDWGRGGTAANAVAAPFAVYGIPNEPTCNIVFSQNQIIGDPLLTAGGGSLGAYISGGDCRRIVIRDNAFSGIYTRALFIGGTGGRCRDVTVAGNLFDNCIFGVLVSQVGNAMLIEGNRFTNMSAGQSGASIYFQNTVTSTGHVIRNNFAEGAAAFHRGVRMEGGDGSLISGNHFSGATPVSFQYTSGCVVENNTLVASELALAGGVHLLGSSHRNTFRGNTVRGRTMSNRAALCQGDCDFNTFQQNYLPQGTTVVTQFATGTSNTVGGNISY